METEERRMQIDGQAQWQIVRENGRSYLMLEDSAYENGEQYAEEEEWEQLKALSVPGLLDCKDCYRNGKRYWCYDITGKQSLKEYYQEREIGFQDCRSLLMSMDRVLCQLYECLLSEEKLQLAPDKIYIGMEEKEMWLAYGGDWNGNFLDNLKLFAEYLISRIDHKDDNGVTLAYQFYKYASGENFNMGEFLSENRVYLNPEKMELKEQEDFSGQENEEKIIVSFAEGSEYYEIFIPSSGSVFQRQEKRNRSIMIKKYMPVLYILPVFIWGVMWICTVCDRIWLIGAGAAYVAAVAVYHINRYRYKVLEKKEQIACSENGMEENAEAGI